VTADEIKRKKKWTETRRERVESEQKEEKKREVENKEVVNYARERKR